MYAPHFFLGKSLDFDVKCSASIVVVSGKELSQRAVFKLSDVMTRGGGDNATPTDHGALRSSASRAIAVHKSSQLSQIGLFIPQRSSDAWVRGDRKSKYAPRCSIKVRHPPNRKMHARRMEGKQSVSCHRS
jgi:hypothetical protein